MNFLRNAKDLVLETVRAWRADDAPRIGAALSYYTTFSIAPVLVIAISVAGAVLGPEVARDGLNREIEAMVGPVGAEAIKDMLANTRQGGGGVLATIIGAVTLVLGATSVFVELQSALNRIWDAPPPATKGIWSFLRLRSLSFAIVLVVGFLLLVSLVVSAGLTAAGDQVGRWISLPPIVLTLVNTGLSLAVVTGLFAVLYKVLPDAKIAWSDVWAGAFVTAGLFTVGKALIGLYLGHSSIASAYGAAGSFAVMLVWIYYSAQLVLFGAE